VLDIIDKGRDIITYNQNLTHESKVELEINLFILLD